jgi:hypothetical protein
MYLINHTNKLTNIDNRYLTSAQQWRAVLCCCNVAGEERKECKYWKTEAKKIG